MQSELTVIITIYGVLVCLNLILMTSLHFLHDRRGSYKWSAMTWLALLSTFILDGLTSPMGANHVVCGPALLLGGYAHARLASSLVDIRFAYNRMAAVGIVLCILAAVIHFTWAPGFAYVSMFTVLVPSTLMIYAAFVLFRHRKKFKVAGAFYAALLFVEGAHLLDYPFLRPIDSIAIYGFGFALILGYSTSILVPVLINQKIGYDSQAELQQKVEEKVSELRFVEAKLSESRKLAALGEMAGGVAHEINTPLGTIRMRSHQIGRLLRQDSPDIAKALSFLDSIEAVSADVAAIVSGLREFSRDSGEDVRGPFALNEIVKDALSLCKMRIASQDIALDVEGLDSTVEVFGRSVQMSQAILNMIQNAMHAVGENEERHIFIEVGEEGDNAFVSIRDNGHGVPKHLQYKIFEPFFTTKDIGSSAGLGLSAANGIIKEHGGVIHLESVKGSTHFKVTLPKYKAKRVVA